MSKNDAIAKDEATPFRSNARLTRPRPLYRVSDVMEILNTSRTTVWKETKAGKLKAVRIGRSIRFEPDEVDRYLATLAA